MSAQSCPLLSSMNEGINHIKDATDHGEEMGVSLGMNTDGDLDVDTGETVLDAEVQSDCDHDDVSLLRSSLNNTPHQVCQLKEKINHLQKNQ